MNINDKIIVFSIKNICLPLDDVLPPVYATDEAEPLILGNKRGETAP